MICEDPQRVCYQLYLSRYIRPECIMVIHDVPPADQWSDRTCRPDLGVLPLSVLHLWEKRLI